MKHLIYAVILFLFGLFIYGCDSPSESKATPVNKPKLLAPGDGATGVSLTPIFKWDISANIIQIDDADNFADPLIYSYDALNGVTEYTLPPIGLFNGITYYWRVGVNSGSTITWSESYFRFTTQ